MSANLCDTCHGHVIPSYSVENITGAEILFKPTIMWQWLKLVQAHAWLNGSLSSFPGAFRAKKDAGLEGRFSRCSATACRGLSSFKQAPHFRRRNILILDECVASEVVASLALMVVAKSERQASARESAIEERSGPCHAIGAAFHFC